MCDTPAPLPPLPSQEEKKKFERASERYYQALDRYLGMSQKKAMNTPEDKVGLVDTAPVRLVASVTGTHCEGSNC